MRKPKTTRAPSADKPAKPRRLKAKAPEAVPMPPSGVPRLLAVGDRVDAARDAVGLGFSGLLFDPYGKVMGPLNEDAVRRAAEFGRDAVADLPFALHAPEGGLAEEQPGWLSPEPPPTGALDPRGEHGRPSRRLLTERGELHGELASWLGRTAARLQGLGATGVRVRDVHLAPGDFWRLAAQAMRDAAPGMTLIADGLSGPFAATLACADDFDLVMDSGAWWDGRSGWLPEQLAQLPVPTLGSPAGIDDDREVVEPGARTLRTVVLSSGLAVPLRLMEHGGESYRALLADLLAFRAKAGWLDAPGVLSLANGALVRTEADPRTASYAVAYGRGGGFGGALTAAGGGFVPTGRIAEAGSASLFALAPRERTGDKLPGGRAAEKALFALAEARVAIEGVHPVIDGGRFPAKRIVGDALAVGADIFCDGHDTIVADLVLTQAGAQGPVRVPLQKGINDRWGAEAVLTSMGRASFRIEAWRDLFGSWLSEVGKKRAAGVNVDLEAIEGRDLARRGMNAAAEAKLSTREQALVRMTREALDDAGEDTSRLLTALTNPDLERLLRRHGERTNLTASPDYPLTVDRRQARFSSWYEMFPRSQSGTTERHGTLRDVIEKLPYVRDLGFDVLYFPPIHPIGRTNMKGKNNTLTPDPDDVGSPYAIGSEAGGHDALHPELGTLDDFQALVKAAAAHGLELALDFAIQCSPDHPWLKEHPEWFDWRPDGSIKFAENPPKKYEDIVNVHFYRKALPDLWYALRDVVLFWCEQGVRIFRVDNPHTKPYPFWEWMIGEVKAAYPDALFLSEAFTRPKVMKRLGKLGFTQSYTYYTWRNTKHELETYVRQLTETDDREVMNPNFFVNTPDINPVPLQTNNRAAHVARTWLAGTLASSWGLYNGIEIVESTVLPGKEEYLNSEKYEIRVWDMDRPGHIKDDIRLLNRLRRTHPALQDHVTVKFLTAWNDQITWFAKRTPDLADYLLFAVTFDYEREQRASVEIPLWEFGLGDDAHIAARDLVSGNDFTWGGKWQELTLSPDRPYAAFQLFGPVREDPPALYPDPEAQT